MKILIVTIILMTSSVSMASRKAITGLLSMESSAFNIGANFDIQSKKTHSFGFGFLYGAKNEDTNRQSFWSLNGDIKAYFGPSRFRLYIAPGIAISSFDNARLPGDETVMTFGTVFKIGSIYRITKAIGLGLEYFHVSNWFSKDTYSSYRTVNLSVRAEF